jgi:ATP-dependent protease ClpP protease subunit
MSMFLLLVAIPAAAEQNQTVVELKVVIRFFAPINEYTVGQLLDLIDKKRSTGTQEFVILLSTQGGDVGSGITAYNYLKALPKPVTVVTHNIGRVDSIGVIVYCAGSKRLCVPQARFLIHGVKSMGDGPVSMDEKLLEERLKTLKVDSENIARVIAANSKKNLAEVRASMSDRTTLNPEQAISWGLTQEIKTDLYDTDDFVYRIEPGPRR